MNEQPFDTFGKSEKLIYQVLPKEQEYEEIERIHWHYRSDKDRLARKFVYLRPSKLLLQSVAFQKTKLDSFKPETANLESKRQENSSKSSTAFSCNSDFWSDSQSSSEEVSLISDSECTVGLFPKNFH